MEAITDASQAVQKLSILRGPSEPPLLDLTLGELLDLQDVHHGDQECLIIPWTGARWTYHDLSSQSSALAAALLDRGVASGDRVAIMAGNCEQYAAVFFAAAKIGAILVILNNAYTAEEAMHGLRFTNATMFFTTQNIGRTDNTKLLGKLRDQAVHGPEVVILRGPAKDYSTYEELVRSVSLGSLEALRNAMSRVLPRQVVNLQFTSGTTGLPKAAMLTH